jgi:hypothetical protein
MSAFDTNVAASDDRETIRMTSKFGVSSTPPTPRLLESTR